jgi:hypothetical protein
MIGFGLWCDASPCPAYSSSSYFGPAGSANVNDIYVSLNDPNTTPNVSASGPLWADANGGWISGLNVGSGLSLSFGGTDPAGVCGLEAAISNSSSNVVASQSADNTPDYDASTNTFTQPAPCGASSRGASWSRDLAALPTGMYYLNVEANNPAGYAAGSYGYAAGSSLATGEPLLIDNSLPSVSVTPTQSPNAAGWYDAAPQTVTVTGNAAPNASPISAIDCTGPGAPSGPQYVSQLTIPVSQPGGTITCTTTSQAGNTSPPVSASLQIDPQTPTVAFNSPAGWINHSQTVTVTGSEPQPLSGIASVSCQLNGGAWTTTPGSQATVDVTAQGANTISCYSTTVAGVQGQTATSTVQIDSTRPTVTFANGPDQSRWSTTAQAIDVTATKPSGLSAVQSITCSVEGQSSTYPATGGPDTETVHVTVQPPGGQLTCSAQDEAGNVSATQAWNFLIDDTPPTGQFAPPSPQSPDQVSVLVADSGSGVASGQIQLEESTGWQNLPTTYEAATGILTATIPDNGSIPDGTYQLRALVWDVAGNEATITDDPSAGTPAAITLPLRIVTQLIVGRATLTKTRCSLRRRVIHPADRSRHRRIAARLAKVCETTRVPLETAAVRLHYGQRARVNGLLETIDGTPIPGQSITITEQAPGWSQQQAGSISTDPQGRFTYTMPVGASRTVTFAYPGTNVLRSTSATAGVLVVGKSTITITRRAKAGHKLRISGRLEGGYVPPGCVLVQLWYRVKGIPAGFGPFEHAIATNSQGRWSITFPVSRGARGYTYLFNGLSILVR